MRPSEVRECILQEHEELRGLLARVDDLARRAARGEDGECLRALRAAGLQLHDRLVAHLDLEDRYLVPAVREADAWGEERASRISQEHEEQRELLEYIRGRLRDANRLSILLGRELHGLVEALLADMAQEEEAVLTADLLRDDVVGIDVETG